MPTRPLLPVTDQIALFVIEQKAKVRAKHPTMSEDHIKDEVMMSLARDLLVYRAAPKPDALIAELLGALKDAVTDLEATLRGNFHGWECGSDELLGEYRAAIARAEGRS